MWKVDTQRYESVAEHIYGTQMLSFVINSEFNLDLNVEKVILMLAMHELGETIVGDIPLSDIISGKITKEQKHKIEKDAVIKILEPLKDKQRLIDIFNEFEDKKQKKLGLLISLISWTHAFNVNFIKKLAL